MCLSWRGRDVILGTMGFACGRSHGCSGLWKYSSGLGDVLTALRNGGASGTSPHQSSNGGRHPERARCPAISSFCSGTAALMPGARGCARQEIVLRYLDMERCHQASACIGRARLADPAAGRFSDGDAERRSILLGWACSDARGGRYRGLRCRGFGRFLSEITKAMTITLSQMSLYMPGRFLDLS